MQDSGLNQTYQVNNRDVSKFMIQTPLFQSDLELQQSGEQTTNSITG